MKCECSSQNRNTLFMTAVPLRVKADIVPAETIQIWWLTAASADAPFTPNSYSRTESKPLDPCLPLGPSFLKNCIGPLGVYFERLKTPWKNCHLFFVFHASWSPSSNAIWKGFCEQYLETSAELIGCVALHFGFINVVPEIYHLLNRGSWLMEQWLSVVKLQRNLNKIRKFLRMYVF